LQWWPYVSLNKGQLAVLRSKVRKLQHVSNG
jgi:hypothetical protein